MLYYRGNGQQGERAVQGRNERYAEQLLRSGEHRQENAAECDGRDQVRDEYQLLNNLAVQLAAALGADITDDLAEDGAEYTVYKRQLEGIDQRILDTIIDEEISIGDYVLTGGELPALVLTDAVARMCEGVLPDAVCFEEESHYNGLLEYPQYTRPEVWHEQAVPPVLLSGHHKNIETWRFAASLQETKEKRPDLYAKYVDKK